MKKKLGKNKNSGMKNAVTKTIPLSVAIALFASASVSAATLPGCKIAVVDPHNHQPVTFNTDLMRTNPNYRQEALKWLRGAWNGAKPIYISEDGEHFVDFSTDAEPGDTLADVLEKAEEDGETFDVTSIEEIPILGEDNVVYNG